METEIDELPTWHAPKLPRVIPQSEDILEMVQHITMANALHFSVVLVVPVLMTKWLNLLLNYKPLLYMLSEAKNGLSGIILMMWA